MKSENNSFSKYSSSLNLSIPAIAAPMFLVSNPELSMECCTNGVIGSFPLANARPISMVESWMSKMQSFYNPEKHAPYAVNMIVHSSYARFSDEIALIKEYKPPIVITSLGDPGRVTSAVHEYGGKVWSDVNNLKFAKKAAHKDIDGLILVCAGAGGHTGNIAAANFINEVRKFWDKTIILAGGIMTGDHIRSALELGADLVYMGTRFIASSESSASSDYKSMLLDAGIEDLVLTDKITGVPAHFLVDSLENAGIKIDKMATKEFNTDFTSQADEDKKAWRDIWSAGQGVGDIHEIEPAATIIERLKKEFKQ